MRALLLPVLLLVLGLSSCKPGSYARPAVTSNVSSSNTCCDEGDLPHLAGAFLVQTFEGQLLSYLEEGSLEAILTYELDPPDPLRMNIITGRNLFGDPELQPIASGDRFDLGTVEFGLSTDACEYGTVQVELRIEVTGRRQDNGRLEIVRFERSFQAVNDCVLDPGDPGDPGDPMVGGTALGGARWMVEEIVGEPLFGFELLERPARHGVPTRHPDARVAPQVPVRAFAETVRHGALVVDLDAADLDRAFLAPGAAFGDLAGNAGAVPGVAPCLTTDAALPLQPGRYLLAWQLVDAPVPFEVPAVGDLEYGLFLDTDPSTAGGFAAGAPFSCDPRAETDHWLTLHRGVGDRWRCTAHSVERSGGRVREVPSAARVLVSGDAVLWLVPLVELDAPTDLAARHAVFWHDGTFGQFGGGWAADTTPPVDQPMLSIDLGGGTPRDAVRIAPR